MGHYVQKLRPMTLYGEIGWWPLPYGARFFINPNFLFVECGTNSHHKCYKKMPHTCGVNQSLLAAALEKLDKLPSVEVQLQSISLIANRYPFRYFIAICVLGFQEKSPSIKSKEPTPESSIYEDVHPSTMLIPPQPRPKSMPQQGEYTA